jgi:hypothetical protein
MLKPSEVEAAYLKLPATASCGECTWELMAADTEPEDLERLRLEARQHVIDEEHPVQLRLRQDILLTPKQPAPSSSSCTSP